MGDEAGRIIDDGLRDALILGSLTIHGDRAALFAALAKAQAGYETIQRTRTVQVRSEKGNYEFSYAPLEEVISATLPALNANGLAYTAFLADAADDERTDLHTLLTHESGAFIHVLETLPPVTKAQERGSQVSYKRRYQYQCVTGSSAEFDDDGNAADGNKVEGMSSRPQRREPQRTPPAPKPRAQPADSTGLVQHDRGEPVKPTPAQAAREKVESMATPAQKATFMGPTVFNEPPVESVPERAIVNDEPMTDEMVQKIRAAFVQRKMGGVQATEFVRKVTGKKREECTLGDGDKILRALEAM